ncbi:hypothetical protein BDW02DRAFT_433547 [Decorospora gaudefroyi]|uniref:Uncharacterized protein n=1 Tax=Decorospora gaudefroyi TaxID=184978 RepID=A0A6A5K662_9PLEO|nr:hypothetical protein BDW02DRAFT_433547 [Decorospora gaudefroyi]
MAFPPPSPSPASPSSSEKDTDVQSPETQPSTDPSEATQASASDNPSTPILSVPGSNFLTPAAARTPTHSRDDAAGPPDMRPPASRLNDRLGLALRSTRDGTVKQQRFNDTPDLPESGESSHTRVSGWLDGSAPTGEIDAAREEAPLQHHHQLDPPATYRKTWTTGAHTTI